MNSLLKSGKYLLMFCFIFDKYKKVYKYLKISNDSSFEENNKAIFLIIFYK